MKIRLPCCKREEEVGRFKIIYCVKCREFSRGDKIISRRVARNTSDRILLL
jgi:ribosomal protein S26